MLAGLMNAEQIARLVSRIQIKALLRRQAEIGPSETMFDGIAPVGYALGSRPIRAPAEIGSRLASIERWLDDHPHRPIPDRAETRRRVRKLEESIERGDL